MIRAVGIVLLLLASTISHAQFESHLSEQSPVSTSGEVEALGWVSPIGGFLDDVITSHVPLSNNSTVVGGTFTSGILIGDEGHESSQTTFDDMDAFIAILNETNEWNFSLSFGSIGVDSVTNLGLLSDGDLIVSGNYCLGSLENECTMQLGSLPALEKEEDSHEGNAFIARYDFLTGWQWAESIGNRNTVRMSDLYIDENDLIHTAVMFQEIITKDQDVLIGGTAPSYGILVFNESGISKLNYSTESDSGSEPFGGFCQNSDGDTFITFTFFGSLLFENLTLESKGGTDIVVIKYNESGWVWMQQGGGTGNDMTTGCVAGHENDIVIFGGFEGNATFGQYYTETSQWLDGVQATISTDGTWKAVNTEGGIGYEMFSDAYRTPSGSTIYAGITTKGFTLGNEILEEYDDDDTYFGTDIFLAEQNLTGSWDWAIMAGSLGRDLVYEITPSNSGGTLATFTYEGTGVFGNHSIQEIGRQDGGIWHYETDIDGDGLLDGIDNCPRVPNVEQENFDLDVFGDACDDDDDNDGIIDSVDACEKGALGWTSTTSTDYDQDGCRDYDEDFDDDNDTILDHLDACVRGPLGWVSTEENDVERDGCSDYDVDEDGFVDQLDNCPNIENSGQEDLDGDSFGDVCDSDQDGDGILDAEDKCPRDLGLWDSSESNDWDRDGCHDSVNDADDDNDGMLDMLGSLQLDMCPKGYRNWDSSNISLDLDQDGCHDELEDDDNDGDGFEDISDLCPSGLVGPVLPSQDFDTDGCVDDVEDIDNDADGVLNEADICPRTPLDTTTVDGSGCSPQQADTDSDGIFNKNDLCPSTALGEIVDEQGCTVIEAEPKAEEPESSFGLNQLLIIFTLILVGVAAYMRFKPVEAPSQTSQEKTVPTLDTEPEAVQEEVSEESELVEEDHQA